MRGQFCGDRQSVGMSAETRARAVIQHAIEQRAFPAAVASVGNRSGAIWTEAFGRLTFDDDAPAATRETIFDLASLTKPLATTTVAMDLAGSARLALDEPVAALVGDWRSADREMVTVADLLEHASGLPARLVDPPPDDRREFEHEIATIRLEYPPRTRSVYSDIGFILLGFILESRGGATLDAHLDAICRRIGIGGLYFPVAGRSNSSSRIEPGVRVAPTTPLPEDRRKRQLVGEVHDNYAYALGGVAGHAGLFGTAPAVGEFAAHILRAAVGDNAGPPPLTPPLVRRFTRRTGVPGSSRALGWDTMLPTSSCGTQMSSRAFGHVGFTGTSLWIDPVRDRYFVLLTNRACGGSMEDRMREARAFHDAWA